MRLELHLVAAAPHYVVSSFSVLIGRSEFTKPDHSHETHFLKCVDKELKLFLEGSSVWTLWLLRKIKKNPMTPQQTDSKPKFTWRKPSFVLHFLKLMIACSIKSKEIQLITLILYFICLVAHNDKANIEF